MEFIIITGLSGAGKSVALNALEDIDYYCVDNIPAALLPVFYELCEKSNDKKMKRVAVVIDVRSGNMFKELISQLSIFKQEGKEYKLLFLDAASQVLLRRYKETRRKHPLFEAYQNITVQDAVEFEKQLLSPIKPVADYITDTSELSAKQLKERIVRMFCDDFNSAMLITCMSFGFKYGLPLESDLVFDVRCLPNPFYVKELKPLTGLDSQVSDFVLNSDITRSLVDKLFALLDLSMPLYCSEGKSSLVISVGCTGGKHRSVTLAKLLGEHFTETGYRANIYHRDISKN